MRGWELSANIKRLKAPARPGRVFRQAVLNNSWLSSLLKAPLAPACDASADRHVGPWPSRRMSLQRIPSHPDVFLAHLFESPGTLRQTQSMTFEDHRGNFPSEGSGDLGIAFAAIQPFQEGNFIFGPTRTHPTRTGFASFNFWWHSTTPCLWINKYY